MRCRLLVHDEFENYYFCPASNRSFDFDEDIKNYEECKPEWCPLEEGVPIVHGHWVISSDGYYPFCSRCKKESKKGVLSKFCPECGAKMDESEDNDNA